MVPQLYRSGGCGTSFLLGLSALLHRWGEAVSLRKVKLACHALALGTMVFSPSQQPDQERQGFSFCLALTPSGWLPCIQTMLHSIHAAGTELRNERKQPK